MIPIRPLASLTALLFSIKPLYDGCQIDHYRTENFPPAAKTPFGCQLLSVSQLDSVPSIDKLKLKKKEKKLFHSTLLHSNMFSVCVIHTVARVPL